MLFGLGSLARVLCRSTRVFFGLGGGFRGFLLGSRSATVLGGKCDQGEGKNEASETFHVDTPWLWTGKYSACN
jgi:hypothetical protein